MSWLNYANLDKPVEIPEAEVSGPGEHRRNIQPANAHKSIPLGLETRSGGATTPPPAEAVEFAKRQRVRRSTVNPDVRTRAWLNNAMSTSNNDYDAFVTKVIAYLRRAINEQSLSEAQAVLNELSRTPEGAAAVQKQLTHENLALAIKISKGQA